MTLFKKADEDLHKSNDIFKDVIDTFYEGKEDQLTLEILEKQKEDKNKAEKQEEISHNKNNKEPKAL